MKPKLIQKKIKIYKLEEEELLAIIDYIKDLLNDLCEIYQSPHQIKIKKVIKKDSEF